MRIVLAAAGSRGDAAPFLALAGHLTERGHDVRLLTHAAFAASAAASGVHTVPVDSDPDALLAGPAARALRRGDARQLARTRHLFAEFVDSFAQPARKAMPGADAVVASTFAIAPAALALQTGVPLLRAHQWPEAPGLVGPAPLLPYAWNLPAPARRGARAALRSMERFLGGVDGQWHGGRLTLTPHHPVGLTTQTHGSLYAFSPRLTPEFGQGPGEYVTGWWRSGASRPLSPATARLLDADGPWVHLGFGSMPQRHPGRLVEMAADVCRRLGVRAVAQVRGVTPGAHGPLVLIGDEPHEELFPQVAALVHHGGAGTTGAGVTAGVPAVVVPHFADQFYWGHRLRELGVAPAPLPRAVLSAGRLTRRLTVALSDDVRGRAAALGESVAGERGLVAATDVIEGCLARGPGAGATGRGNR